MKQGYLTEGEVAELCARSQKKLRCRRCNSGILINEKTGLCWFCKIREGRIFEIKYIRIAREAI